MMSVDMNKNSCRTKLIFLEHGTINGVVKGKVNLADKVLDHYSSKENKDVYGQPHEQYVAHYYDIHPINMFFLYISRF